MDFPAFATCFSGISFLFFGVSCLSTAYMKSEFVRYGLDRYRPLTGVLQLLGGAGLLIGYGWWPLLALVAAAGLSLMMACGFAVRMKIGDSLWLATPALFYTVLNGYLAVHYWGSW